MTAKTPDHLLELVVNLYNEGMAAPEIERKTGVSTGVIYRTLHQRGIRPNQYPRTGLKPWNRGNSKLTEQQEFEIAEHYRSGKSLSELEEMYDATAGTFRKILRRLNVPMRKRGNGVRSFSPNQVEDIKQRWLSGEPQSSIATVYRTGQSIISRLLQYHGIESKPRMPRGEKHGMWKGGRHIVRGYVNVRLPANSPYHSMVGTSGYIQEHRLIMAQHLGRPLERHETVHHINGDKSDNRIENLQLRIGNHGINQILRCRCCGSYDIEAVPIED